MTALIDELLAAPPNERGLIIPGPRMVEPVVPVGRALEAVVRDEFHQARATSTRRPWHASPHYSKLLGRGAVIDADGQMVAVDEEWMPNALTNDGQAEDINVLLRGTAASAGYYLGLTVVSTATTNIPSKTATSANLTQTVLNGGATVTEADTTKGYGRIQILQAAWGAPSLNSGDQQTSAAQKTFGPAATSNWSGTTTQPAQIAYAILISTASGATGTWVLWIALSGATTINVAQSFAYTLSLKVT